MKIQVKMTRSENLAHYGVSKNTVVAVDLEGEYLPICVSSEIYESNTRTPPEAKKAQAIAARTYAASFMNKGSIVDDTANTQAFSWKDPAKIPNCVKAAGDTSGQVLMCEGKMITAWYSNSNGGRTKSSKEAWGGETAWTVSKDDPWDPAGREKWGEVPPSHCVGLSQIGAAYAASIGTRYKDILSFYYPNTDVAGNMGENIPAPEPQEEVKNNIGLVKHAQQWLGQAYWYGTCCYACTTSLLKSKTAQYPSHYTTSRMPRYQQDIERKKSCADCIGLMKGYIWEKDGKVVYNKTTDVNTSGLFNKATIKGPINTLPEVPGVMLYKSGHVGIYEGSGSVIEAKGFAYGVIRSRVSDTPWTHWLVCPFCSYAGYENQLKPAELKEPYVAVVVTKSSPLNIWQDTSKSKSLLKVAKGDTMTVTGYADRMGWLKVEKNGVIGVADGQYLAHATVVPDAEDDADDAEPTPATPYLAKVVNVTTGLNLRTAPVKGNNTLLLVPLGAKVTVLDDAAENGFWYVDYLGTKGYVTSAYLVRISSES